MPSYTKEQIAGNRLRLSGPVKVHIGAWDSDKTVTWGPGTGGAVGSITPSVYSVWTPERNGTDAWYYQIGEIPPIYFIKHDADKLDLVPDSGGADQIKPDLTVGGDALSFETDFLSLSNLDSLLKIGLAGIGLFVGIKIFGLLQN